MAFVIKFALVTEAVINILAAVLFIVFPQACLSHAVLSSSSSSPVPGSTALLCQVYGAIMLSLAVPLLLCVADTTAAYEKRRIVYKTMAAGEIAFIILMLRAGQDYEATGFTPEFLTKGVMAFAPALAWHSYALFVHPAIMRTAGGAAPHLGTKKDL